MEMLRDRDYVVAEFELAFTKEAFREKYGDEPKREDLVIQKPKRSNTAEHVSFVCAPCNFYPAGSSRKLIAQSLQIRVYGIGKF
jgi:hypothetical protein